MIATKPLKWVLGLTLTTGLLSSCGPKEADKVGEAQLCIDHAAQGAAAACMDKIAGIESKGAYTLRCSAGFIDEGFTQPVRFKAAFDALSTNATSNTEAFLGVLAFSSKSTSALNKTFAGDTYTNCVKSGAKGMMLLGSMATTATTLSALAGSYVNGTQPDATQITGAITAALADPTAKAAIGAAVATTYTSTCQTGQQADVTLCTQLNTALVGIDLANSTAVGNAILNYWSTH
jgi:hypothetical protein